MVLQSRLEFLRQQIQAGIPALITSSTGSAGTGKIKVVLQHGAPASHPRARQMLLAMLQAASYVIVHENAVDRGHRFHHKNISEVSFWLSGRHAPVGGGDYGPGGHDDGDDDNDANDYGHKRHNRGRSASKRSPPSDPWHSGGSDPWGGTGRLSPPKHSRTRAKGAYEQKQLGAWRPIRTAASSTPDPPPIYVDKQATKTRIDENRSSSKATLAEEQAERADRERHFLCNPQTLDIEGWAHVHARFPPRGQLIAASNRRVKALRELWDRGEVLELPAGSPVLVHDRIWEPNGHILRRGFGVFQHFYRVKFENTDQWVECYLCTENAGPNLYDAMYENARAVRLHALRAAAE